MNDPRILKLVVRLGVPGLALYVFYLLLNHFVFKFETIGATWAAVIAILFIFVIGGIIFYALRAWRPPQQSLTPRDREIEIGVKVVITLAPQQLIESEEGLVQWRATMNEYRGRHAKVVAMSRQGAPAVKLDVDYGKHWWSTKWLALVE